MLSGTPWRKATSTVLAVGALLMCGCSSQQEAGAWAHPSKSTASTSAHAGPLTTTQLKQHAFKEGEVSEAREGGIPVTEPEPEGAGRSFPPVSDPACQTMIDIRSGQGASARIFQTFNWKGDIWGGGSTLASYEDEKAKEAFAELEHALASCRSFEGEGYGGKFKATVVVEGAPQVGDEAVSFREIIPMGPEYRGDRNEQYIVVRAGNTIATFTMLNVAGSSSFPAELVSRQVDRLRDAQRP
ncbi:hypothetical protein [Streptomyces wuyuanensis]|uniref:hypothetical protein n=1 Tax=Streptomyces wuyuanensis TaxID=1196353 RepID=UPI0037BD6FD3